MSNARDALMSNYSPLPVSFESGSGAYLIDSNGRQYLDAISGLAVCALGHAHPAISKTICEQADKVLHTSNLYRIALQEKLAERLVEKSGMQKVFFGNSGAEANEAAIKLARLYGNQQGYRHSKIIVMEGSFHGRTMAALSATGNKRAHKGFEPLVQGFIRVPYNNIDALKNTIAQHDEIVAVMLEAIQGEGGIVIPDKSYLRQIRALCDENNILLILDEIQTGMCRTGKWFACQHEDILPDIMTLAKALGNGVPIGACLASGKSADLFQPGSHGSTFGGNPLAAAVGLAVIDTLERDKLDQRAAYLGGRMRENFDSALANISGIRDIRGRGLMIGIELDRDCTALIRLALEQGLLINVTAGKTIRLLPSLIIGDEEADKIAEKVSRLIISFLG